MDHRESLRSLQRRGSDTVYKKKIETYGRVLRTRPENFGALIGRANASIKLNRKSAALVDLKKALGLAKSKKMRKETQKIIDKTISVEGIDFADDSDLAPVTISETPGVTFKDVVGMERLKEEIRRAIVYPLEKASLAKEYDRRFGGGVLLYGPPNCGKTLLVKAAAGESQVNFVEITIPMMEDTWAGNTEKNFHKAFQVAKKNAPCIFFLDEVDALGGRREDSNQKWMRQEINALLKEMSDISESKAEVLVIGSTNMPWFIDPAFKRYGRFDRILYVPPPDGAAREALFRFYLPPQHTSSVVDYARLAELTEFRSSGDIVSVCQQAIDAAWLNHYRTGKKQPIEMNGLMNIIKSQRSGLMEWYEDAKRHISGPDRTGVYHELTEEMERLEHSSKSRSAVYG